MSRVFRMGICLAIVCIPGCQKKAPGVPAAKAVSTPIGPKLVLVQGEMKGESPGADPETPRAAVIYAMEQKSEPLDETAKWSKVPEFVKGLPILRNPLEPWRGKTHLNLRIDAPGLIVLAAYKKILPYGSSEAEIRQKSRSDLDDQGWEMIGELIKGDPTKNLHELASYVIYRKQVKAGDEVVFRGGLYSGPCLIVVDAAAAKTIAAVPRIDLTLNDLSHLPKRPALTGGLAPEHANQLILTAHPANKPERAAAALERELARQALLITARDDFGLGTHDTLLGESLPLMKASKHTPWGVLASQTRETMDWIVTVVRPVGDQYQVLWEKSTILKMQIRTEPIVELCSKWSQDEFPKLLQKHGWKPKEHKTNAVIHLPDNLDARLLSFNPVTQFGLIQELHRFCQEHGESPALLRGLSRAYANLSILTANLSSPAFRVHQARSLLYAERAWNKAPHDPASYWSRAYVRTLVGFHAGALEDLAAADAIVKENRATNAEAMVPIWVKVIRDFCEFNQEELKAAEQDESVDILALHLQVLAAPPSSGDRRRWQAALRLLEKDSESSFGFHTLNQRAPLGIHRASTEDSIPALVRSLSDQIPRLKGIPDAARKLCEAETDSRDFERVKAILGTHGELLQVFDQQNVRNSTEVTPSWRALRSLIHEYAFQTVRSRLEFYHYSLGVDSNDILTKTLPLVDDHPFQASLQFANSDHEKRKLAAAELLDRYDAISLDGAAETVGSFVALELPNDPRAQVMGYYYYYHRSGTYQEVFELIARSFYQQGFPIDSKICSDLSPHAPLGVMSELRDTKSANHAEKVAGWRKKYSNDAMIQRALGKHFDKQKDWDQAEDCLERAMDLLPSQSTAIELSKVYLKQDKNEQAEGVLKEALELESPGLEHAQVASTLANILMKRKEWNAALPYAQMAGDSYSNWGLACVQICYEGLKDFDQAEQIVKARANRYDNERMEWYFWCCRFGHGDVKSARALAEAHLASFPKTLSENDYWRAICFHILTDQDELALQDCIAAQKRFRVSPFFLQAALLELKLGRTDAALKQIASSKATPIMQERYGDILGILNHSLPELATRLVEFLESKKVDHLAPEVLTEIEKSVQLTPRELDDAYFYAGMCLWHTNERDLATRYLKRAAGSPNNFWLRLLASDVLHDAKIPFELPTPTLD